MPPATRLTDICTGHGCFPPRPSSEGSPDVIINNLKAMRVGDAYLPHGCGKCSPHPGVLAAGSSSVFINGRPAGRIGDAVSCGSTAATGSPDVIIGG